VSAAAKKVASKFGKTSVFQPTGTPQIQTSTTISAVPPQGLRITAPGTYTLTQSVTQTPQADGSVAIYIAASNVTLDFQGYSVTKSPSSPFMKCVAVCVATGTTGVTVANGTVSNFGLYGIAAFNSNQVTVQNMAVTGQSHNDTFSASAGIFVVGCAQSRVLSSRVTNADVQSLSFAGIQSRFCTDFQAAYCTVNDCVNNTGGCSGVSALTTIRAHLHKNSVSGIRAGTTLPLVSPGHTTLGVFLFLSSYVSVTSCTVSDVHGSCDDSHGISVFICSSNIVIRNNHVVNVTSGFTPGMTGAKATGVEVIMAYGTVVENVTVHNVSVANPQDLQCAGFSSSAALDVSFTNCTANNVRCVGAGRGVGFGWAPDPRPAFIQATFNVAYNRCHVHNADIGFDMFMTVRGQVVACTTGNVGVQVSDVPGESRVLTCNPCSECSPAVSTTIVSTGRDNSTK
jgi:hypothetical protein